MALDNELDTGKLKAANINTEIRVARDDNIVRLKNELQHLVQQLINITDNYDYNAKFYYNIESLINSLHISRKMIDSALYYSNNIENSNNILKKNKYG